MDDLRKKEERIKDYVKKGLYMIEGDIIPKLEASKKRAADVEKLKFVIKTYQRIIAKVILRLRKERHFIEDSSERNFKKFIRMYYKELRLSRKTLNDLADLRIGDFDIKTVMTGFLGGAVASIFVANARPQYGIATLSLWAFCTLLSLGVAFMDYDDRRLKYIEKIKKRYDFSIF